MKRLSAKLFSVVVISILASISYLVPVYGATDQNQSLNGFRISPVRSEITIEKGKSQTIEVGVENPTSAQATVKAVINDFIASDNESGRPRLILDDNTPLPKNNFKSLVGNIPSLELGPKERKTINVTISVPADARPGGYYGAIRFLPEGTNEKTTVGLVASVGSLVLVTVPGNLTERVDLTQLSAFQNNKAKSFFTKGDVSVSVRLNNTGDIHVKPFGRVQIKDMFGKVVSNYELNNTEPRSNILPGSTRSFVDNLPKRKWLGRYVIEANLGYSQGSGSVLSAKSSFWYVPAWAIITLIGLVLLIVGGVYWLIRRTKAHSGHKHGVNRR